MNELDMLRKLAAVARNEPVPPVDVSRSVIARLSVRQDEWNTSLAWVAGLSLAAALPALVIAIYVLETWTDPLQEMFFNLGGLLT
jgi:hypothetical protein